MVDPITIGAGLLTAIKFFTGRSKRHALERRKQAVAAYGAIGETLRAETDAMMERLQELGVRRAAYIPSLLKRLNETVGRLRMFRTPYDPVNGWFGGKGFREVMDIHENAFSFYRGPVELIDDKTSRLLRCVLLVQGLEALDHLHIIELPVLDDTVGDLMGHIPGAEHIADHLGSVAEATVGDILGGALFVFSLWRIGDNLAKAAEHKEAAQSIEEQLEEVRARVDQARAVRERAEDILERLEESAYEAFKSAWLMERAFQYHGRPDKSARYAPQLQKLEDAARNFWKLLDAKLLPAADEAGATA